jgi:hypothetical protein
MLAFTMMAYDNKVMTKEKPSTDTSLLTTEEFEERMERTETRRREIAPALEEITQKAISVYDVLLPKARHVGDVDREYPLRYQCVFSLGGSALVAEYLMIGFGNHHDLAIERSGSDDGLGPKWLATRSLLLEDLLSEETKIRQHDYSFRVGKRSNSIRVNTLRYPETVGKSGRVEDTLCPAIEGMEGIEAYIEAFDADLDEAVARFA